MANEKTDISVDLSAGASLKAEVKTEVPSESSGRFLDAITDIIRPFSESRGLKADMIRLQRERVIAQIAIEAKERVLASGRDIEFVPNKILVPLLEQASLVEEEDSELADSWAGLLASSSMTPSPNHRVFVDILGKLSAEHLKYLSVLASGSRPSQIEDVSVDLIPHNVARSLKSATTSVLNGKDEYETSDFSKAISKFLTRFDRSGAAVEYLAFTIISSRGEYKGEVEIDDFEELQAPNFPAIKQSLVALGLLQEHLVLDLGTLTLTGPLDVITELYFSYETLTPLGAEFILSCNPIWASRVREAVSAGVPEDAPSFEVLK